MSLRFLLVHGYLGGPEELTGLQQHLIARFGSGKVRSVRLAGHGQDALPPFDLTAFFRSIEDEIAAAAWASHQLVLIGHSTGGTLALAYILKYGLVPAVLVLANTPKQVDGSTLGRWECHREAKQELPFLDMAKMVSLINRIGATRVLQPFPVLIVQGEDDRLVPPETADQWLCHGFSGPVRRLIAPSAGHNPFTGISGDLAADWVAAKAEAFLGHEDTYNSENVERLCQIEGERLSTFIRRRPESVRHLMASPAAARALDLPLDLSDRHAGTEPIQINVELTTRCTLKCPRCARRVYRRPPTDMSIMRFESLLDIFPCAYRVVMAGLGEPTCHPDLPEMVAAAAKQGRHVSLVTNGTQLDDEMSNRLIEAGIASVVFSLDNVDPETAAQTRPGIDIEQITTRIQSFIEKAAGATVATAVFSAVSCETIPHLPLLAETVSRLGVQAWMVTDLNFTWNQPKSVHQHLGANVEGLVKTSLRTAFARRMPVIGVQALEAFGIEQQYGKFLLYPPSQLAHRSSTHQWCVSPWQTAPIDVEGNLTICDNQPEAVVGNVFTTPLAELWHSSAMKAWRSSMQTDEPPTVCRSCPRF